MLLGAAPVRSSDAPYVRPQQLVDIGGRHLNMYCLGRGSPTVILDAGLGSSLFTWHLVQPQLSHVVRICSYDRAGYGFSDPSGTEHTTNANVDDLHRLLSIAHVPKPYLLVAHSLNAFDARVFTDRYRSDVAGMLLIDPSDVDEDRLAVVYGAAKRKAEEAANLSFVRGCDALAHRHRLTSGDDCVGKPNPAESEALHRVQLAHSRSPEMWDAILSELGSVRRDLVQVRAAQRAYGNLPLIVLTAADAEADGAKSQGLSAANIRLAVQLRNQMRNADAGLAKRGINCSISYVSHYIQTDRPRVIINAIRELLHDGQASKPLTCAFVNERDSDRSNRR
jgi:pimeloyl-ACP methyl ester carboxylesterase